MASPNQILPGPKAKDWIARDEAVLSPSYTRGYPFVMARGEGAVAWDVDGNRFVDFTTGIAVTATGHAHPDVVRAIQEQAAEFIHMSGTDFYYGPQVELAEKLATTAPFDGPARVFFGNSGAEAVEAAAKLARYYTKRPQYIAFLHGFHGRTMGALSFTSSKYIQRRGFFPSMPGVTHVPYPDPYHPVLNETGAADQGEAVLRYIEDEIFKTIVAPDEVAAFLVEPIQGEGGYVVPPASFLPGLRELADKYGILLIVDEVQTGVGRTGKWWAIEHFGAQPDIIATAKGIASGMPLGGIIARAEIMDKWVPGAHASTFGGNPVSCAAAIATFNLLESGMIANAVTMGDYMLGKLSEMKDRHPSIGDVRGKGLMVGVEFVKDRETRERFPAIRDKIVDYAFEDKLLLLGAGVNTMRLIPPLNVEQDIIDEALLVFERAIARAEEEML